MSKEVPAVMYHTVGVPNPNWIWSFLTMPYKRFDAQMRFFKRMGYQTLTSEEFIECHKTGRFPERALYLTFDDGYLDNWVFAAPILEKYGYCGTIFVNPDFVDPSTGCRPQYGTSPVSKLQHQGFLNWDEMRSMEKSGVMEIQSHAMTHTWYFTGPEIVDYHHPGDNVYWMDWNQRPDMKWAYLGPEGYSGGFGAPVYEHGKSLSGPRYFPDEALRDALVAFCDEQGPDFFNRSDWRQVLEEQTRQLEPNVKSGRQETEVEFYERVEWELRESKRILEGKLDKSIQVLCWPGGGYSKRALEIGSAIYPAMTLSSGQRGGGGFMENGCFLIARAGAPSVLLKSEIYYPLGLYAHLMFQESKGSRLAGLCRKAMKAVIMLRMRLQV